MIGGRLGCVLAGLLGTLSVGGAAGAEVSETPGRDLGRVSLGLGVDWSEGDYEGERSTDILYGGLRLAYLTPELAFTPSLYDWLELQLTVSALQVDGPAVVRRSSTGAGRPDTERSGGFGDLLLRGSYGFQLARRGAWPYVELAGQLKIPTADEDEGLGTGEVDGTVELTVSQSWKGFSPFASGARRFVGDPPGLNLDDRWLASAGASQRLFAGLGAGLFYDYRQAPSSGTDDAHALVAFFSWKRGSLRFSPYGLVGLSRGSPDFAVGAELRFDVDLRSAGD